MDPSNPDVLLAGLWDFRRQGWTFRSGGNGPNAPSGSGLYRTSDGGKTWTEFTAQTHRGLPAKPYGRIAVQVAPSNGPTEWQEKYEDLARKSRRIAATVEAAE